MIHIHIQNSLYIHYKIHNLCTYIKHNSVKTTFWKYSNSSEISKNYKNKQLN